MFRIKDREFKVERAVVWAHVGAPAHVRGVWDPNYKGVSWHFSVEAAPEILDGDMRWEPQACLDGLILDVRRWQDIEGQVIQWTDWDDMAGQQDYGRLYVFEHTHIRNSTVTFGQRDGALFKFEWRGLCDVFAGDDYYDNLPLLIETRIKFIGIAAYKESNPQRARAMLSQYEDPAAFVQNSTGRCAEKVFAPSDTWFEPKP